MSGIKYYTLLSLLSLLYISHKPINNENLTLEKSFKVKDSIIKEKEIISKNFVLGKFNFRKDTTFTKVASKYATKRIYLKKEAYQAFIKMHSHAQRDGIKLTILSGTRNFNYQKGIWERKWKKYNYLPPQKRVLKILEFSSMPSTSRHHWGTDIDLNNLNNSYFKKGKGKKEYKWLVENAPKYGFYQVYTSKNNGRTGYHMEKWHWSYLPLAQQYLDFYNKNITYKDIKGFKGAKTAKEIQVIEKYVNGIEKYEIPN